MTANVLFQKLRVTFKSAWTGWLFVIVLILCLFGCLFVLTKCVVLSFIFPIRPMKPVLIRHTKIANVSIACWCSATVYRWRHVRRFKRRRRLHGTTQGKKKNEFDICLYIPPLRNRVGGDGIGFRVNKSCTTSKCASSVNILYVVNNKLSQLRENTKTSLTLSSMHRGARESVQFPFVWMILV